jgi:tRNA-2-methylthio-N6-dimethylallyladenosine synthase
MAETENVMPQLHMPLQSGSDKILKNMKRSYRAAKYLGILDRVRKVMPEAAITTDIIVGFPGETEQDFLDTIDIVRKSRFASSFTYQYSKRPGTAAAEMAHQLPKEVVQERYERLLEVVNEVSWEENKPLVGTVVEVLVSADPGRKDSQTNRLTGRARDNRLVHFDVPEGAVVPRPGDAVTLRVTRAAPYFLVADYEPGGLYEVRRTAGGDAHDRRQLESCGVPSQGAPKVSLGLPFRVKSGV